MSVLDDLKKTTKSKAAKVAGKVAVDADLSGGDLSSGGVDLAENLQRASGFSLFVAALIDFGLVGVFRLCILVVTGLSTRAYGQQLLDDIDNLYGGSANFSLTIREHWDFFISSDYIKALLFAVAVCVLVGAVYRMFMWISPWKATVGQRVMKIVVIKKDGTAGMGFFDAFVRVVLTYLAWSFPPLIVYFWRDRKHFSIIFLVLTSVWSDPSFFFGKAGTVPDVFSGTNCYYGIRDGGQLRLGRN